MATYRTRTYIAGDWDTDKDAVDVLHMWNDDKDLDLTFTDAHDLTSSRDSSLNCTIKSSLKSRMNASKAFVLIVGAHTASITAGGCQLCKSYNSYTGHCARGYGVDFRSFIKFECENAVEAGIKIIVLYKDTRVDRDKCPQAVRFLGTHATMVYAGTDGKYYWDYESVENALNL